MSKPHSITVSIVTRTEGQENQETLHTEYASDPVEFTHKDTVISRAVIDAVFAAKMQLKEEFLKAIKK